MHLLEVIFKGCAESTGGKEELGGRASFFCVGAGLIFTWWKGRAFFFVKEQAFFSFGGKEEPWIIMLIEFVGKTARGLSKNYIADWNCL